MASAEAATEIAKALKRLRESSPDRREDLERWNADARRFTRWQHERFAEIALPPAVMFYLHDADLRVKNPEYRKRQEDVLDEVLAELERGVVPRSTGHSVGIRPGWLIAGLIALALLLYWRLA